MKTRLLKTHIYRLYLVTDENQDNATLSKVVKNAVAGGITAVQVREKSSNITTFIERALLVKNILANTNIPLIINDRVDVALAVDADGVHLGQSDMPVTIARKLLGPDKILGLTVENMQQLEDAQKLPLNNIGISTIFATSTKSDTKHIWGLEGLKKAVQYSQIPLVAIGGINGSNISQVAQTQVAGIAIVSAITQAKNVKKAAEDLLAKIISC